MSYVARGMSVFVSVCLGVLLLGYGCSLSETKDINLFDAYTLASFIVGGAFPYAISYSFTRLVEINIDEMMVGIYNQFDKDQRFR